MPPYPEKQSPLLVRLKQKKPLMEAETGSEATPTTTTTTTHSDDAPKLGETAVRSFSKMIYLESSF
jgi:AP-2 complex subunit alpha